MQGLQQRYTTQGVAWLSVISSAPGKQGYVEPAEALNTVKTTKSAASQVLLDPSGTMGKAYGAKTTPHMFIIDPTGDRGLCRRDRRQRLRQPCRHPNVEKLCERRAGRRAGGTKSRHCLGTALRMPRPVLRGLRHVTRL